MKMQIVYKPEAADRQEWVVDRDNPAWPIIYATEKATDWGWLEFLRRLDSVSGIAWRALLWALRKQDEPRLRLEFVEIDWSELEVHIQCPLCEQWIARHDGHECVFPESEGKDEPEPEPEETSKKGKKKAGDDPEA